MSDFISLANPVAGGVPSHTNWTPKSNLAAFAVAACLPSQPGVVEDQFLVSALDDGVCRFQFMFEPVSQSEVEFELASDKLVGMLFAEQGALPAPWNAW